MYTRAGNLSKNADGELVLANDQGQRLEPGITMPQEAMSVSIDKSGRIFVQFPGNVEPQEVGQIQIARFAQPESLKAIGAGLYVETPESGQPLEGSPGTEARGMILQGYLEGSNVSIVRELLEAERVASLYQAWAPFGFSGRSVAAAPAR